MQQPNSKPMVSHKTIHSYRHSVDVLDPTQRFGGVESPPDRSNRHSIADGHMQLKLRRDLLLPVLEPEFPLAPEVAQDKEVVATAQLGRMSDALRIPTMRASDPRDAVLAYREMRRGASLVFSPTSSLSDDFLKDVEQAQKLVRQLTLDFADRAKLAQALEPTARIDARVRGSLQQLAVEVDSILRGVRRYEEQPERYKLSKKEFERRKKISEDLEAQLNEFDKQFSSSYEAPATKPSVNFRGAAASETQETRNLTEKQLRDSKRDMIRQHEIIEQALEGTSENLVVAVHRIGDEVDLHNELLDKAHENAEKKAEDLHTTDYRAKKLIYETSNCCLGTTIVVLIASLLVFLFVL